MAWDRLTSNARFLNNFARASGCPGLACRGYGCWFVFSRRWRRVTLKGPARRMTGGRVEETPRRQSVGCVDQTLVDVC